MCCRAMDVVTLASGKRAGGQMNRIEKRLRELPRPVIGRIADGALRLDLRCLEEADEASFVAQLRTDASA